MIRGSAGCLGIDPTKPKLGQIEFFDEDIDHASRIAETAWSDRDQTPSTKRLVPILPQIARESYQWESKQAMRFYHRLGHQRRNSRRR